MRFCPNCKDYYDSLESIIWSINVKDKLQTHLFNLAFSIVYQDSHYVTL